MTAPIPRAARSELVFGRGRPGPRRPKRARPPESPVTFAELKDLVDRWYPTESEAKRLSCHILYRNREWQVKPAQHCEPKANSQPYTEVLGDDIPEE